MMMTSDRSRTVRTLLYVTAVLVVDLYLHPRGRATVWGGAAGVACFRSVAWLTLPLVLAAVRDHRSGTSRRPAFRWPDRQDGWFLAISGPAMAALLFPIFRFPPLRSACLDPLAIGWGLERCMGWLVALVFWLPGWEILHRHYLLPVCQAAWPRIGWLVPPLFEAAYHLSKSPAEAAGSFLFGGLLCRRTLRSGNLTVPIAAHLMLELEYALFMTYG